MRLRQKCCLPMDLIAYVTEEDRKRWTQAGRTDILHILEKQHGVWAGSPRIPGQRAPAAGDAPFHTGMEALGTCTIYETRPKVCRDYVPGSLLNSARTTRVLRLDHV